MQRRPGRQVVSQGTANPLYAGSIPAQASLFKNTYLDKIVVMRRRSWNDTQLKNAVKKAKSFSQVIKMLGLVPAGGNYVQVQERIRFLKLDNSHFTGYAWNRGMRGRYLPLTPLAEIMVENSTYQSYKLKVRLFREGIKEPKCEQCGWCAKSVDGRIPVELDHINGKHFDNRLENLRILCPNCHSLQLTHRAKNSSKRRRMSGW